MSNNSVKLLTKIGYILISKHAIQMCICIKNHISRYMYILLLAKRLLSQEQQDPECELLTTDDIQRAACGHGNDVKGWTIYHSLKIKSVVHWIMLTRPSSVINVTLESWTIFDKHFCKKQPVSYGILIDIVPLAFKDRSSMVHPLSIFSWVVYIDTRAIVQLPQ